MANDPSPGELPPVSLVVVNARVWTGDPRRPWAEALAVRGETLAAVAGSAEVRKMAGVRARVVDARGALVMASPPGTLVRGAPASFTMLEGAEQPQVGSVAAAPVGGLPVMEVVDGRVVRDGALGS